jgi:hypothetical protein
MLYKLQNIYRVQFKSPYAVQVVLDKLILHLHLACALYKEDRLLV